MNAELLELEITESSLIDNVEFAREQIDRLHQMGISISIDDFGTGYSSLSYLHQFSVDRLKIDQSFVQNLDNPETELITRSIIGLAKSLPR